MAAAVWTRAAQRPTFVKAPLLVLSGSGCEKRGRSKKSRVRSNVSQISGWRCCDKRNVMRGSGLRRWTGHWTGPWHLWAECVGSLPSARALSLPLSNTLAVLSRSLSLPFCACVGYPVHACVCRLCRVVWVCGCEGVYIEEPISTDIFKLKNETDFSSV